jgi:hypothetical protein
MLTIAKPHTIIRIYEVVVNLRAVVMLIRVR